MQTKTKIIDAKTIKITNGRSIKKKKIIEIKKIKRIKVIVN